jgi:hypothetical protein
MAIAVVTKASGGLPVIDVTATKPGLGVPVTEATHGGGIAVTKVSLAVGGLPVTFVADSTYWPPAGGGGGTTYTTWNPADKSASVTLSNGDLTFASAASNQGVRATTGKSSGKYYFECTFTAMGGYLGLAQTTTPFNGTTNAVGVTPGSGWIQVNGSSVINIGGLPSPVAVAVDLGAKKIWFRASPSGNWNGNASYDPATNVGGVDITTVAGAALYPAVIVVLSTNGGTANFGASAFTGAVPAGFTSGWPV